MSKLSQETIAIVSVGVALLAVNAGIAALVLTLNSDIREDGRADRAAWQAESLAMRTEAQAACDAERAASQAARDADRAEARADREAWQAEMRALREDAGADREAVSRLSGIVSAGWIDGFADGISTLHGAFPPSITNSPCQTHGPPGTYCPVRMRAIS